MRTTVGWSALIASLLFSSTVSALEECKPPPPAKSCAALHCVGPCQEKWVGSACLGGSCISGFVDSLDSKGNVDIQLHNVTPELQQKIDELLRLGH